MFLLFLRTIIESLVLLKALHETVVPWSLPYLLNWSGGSVWFKSRHIFGRKKKITCKFRPWRPNFENWKINLVYTLSFFTNFTAVIGHGAKKYPSPTASRNPKWWQHVHRTTLFNPYRPSTSTFKVKFLKLTLGQIANHCPINGLTSGA